MLLEFTDYVIDWRFEKTTSTEGSSNLKMTSVKSELEQSFGVQNVKQTTKKLSTGGKILIALSGMSRI